MKQTTDEVIHRMEIELNELTGRIGSLERFLISKDYQEISSQQKILLAQQHTTMEKYKEILLKRLVDLRNQEEREKYMDKPCDMPCAPAEEEPNVQMCKCVKVESENDDGTPTD